MRDKFDRSVWYRKTPSGWKLLRVKDALFSIDSGAWGDDTYADDEGSPVLRSNEIDEYGHWRNTEPARRLLTDSERVKTRLHEGDLLLVKSSGSQSHIGKTAVVTKRIADLGCCFSNFTARLKVTPQHLDSSFMWYYLNNSPGRDQLFYNGTTTTGLINLSARTIGIGQIALPPAWEQRSIAAYLDASCAAIDAAVAAKRRQIGTLDALRESRIERAITHGLQESSMQPVGLDWIESLPIHWKAVRVKRVLAAMDYGISVSTNDEGRFPVLKMGHIQNGEIEYAKLDYVDDVPETLLLEENDVLYNRTNSPDQVGKAAIFRKTKGEAITFASYLVRLRLNHRVLPEFFNYVANSVAFLGFARRMAIPSVQQSNLNSTRYGRLWIPLPPLEEQHCIVNSLNAMSLEVHATQSVLRKQIDTLTAYRKSLIHECVTGQRRIGEAELAAAGLAP